MRGLTAFVLGVLGVLLGLFLWVSLTGHALPPHFLEDHFLELVTGVCCLLWLLILLKAPWDLYFKAREVAFEQSRAEERGLPLEAGRREYVEGLAPRLLKLAIGLHLFSSAVIGAVTHTFGGQAGYWFAGFYLISTGFRPLLAVYGYLLLKLTVLNEETYFPRLDVVTLQSQVRVLEETYRLTEERTNALNEELFREKTEREEETFALRERLDRIGREFEASLARIKTDAELVEGLRALVTFVRGMGEERGRL